MATQARPPPQAAHPLDTGPQSTSASPAPGDHRPSTQLEATHTPPRHSRDPAQSNEEEQCPRAGHVDPQLSKDKGHGNGKREHRRKHNSSRQTRYPNRDPQNPRIPAYNITMATSTPTTCYNKRSHHSPPPNTHAHLPSAAVYIRLQADVQHTIATCRNECTCASGRVAHARRTVIGHTA